MGKRINSKFEAQKKTKRSSKRASNLLLLESVFCAEEVGTHVGNDTDTPDTHTQGKKD